MSHKSLWERKPPFEAPSREWIKRGYRRLQPSIRAIAKPIVEAVPTHVKRIPHDRLNFFRFPEDGPEDGKFDPEALENEVLEIMTATINGDFRSNSYPKIRPTAENLRSYGITSRNPRIAFIQVLFSTLKDTFKAIFCNLKNLKDAAITKKWVRLTANQIARMHGYNKEKRPVKDSERKYYNVSTGNLITGVEYKALKGQEQRDYKSAPVVSDDNYYRLAPKEKRDIQELPDSATADIDRIEMQELYNLGTATYRRAEPADQLIMYTNQLSATTGLSWDATYLQLEPEYRKVGITTCRGAKKRRDTLSQRYPELKQIKDALEK